MMNTGIPQLSSIKSIHFLKNTLQPHLPEETALQNFREKFTEALKSGWKTQLNFAAHNFTRDNAAWTRFSFSFFIFPHLFWPQVDISFHNVVQTHFGKISFFINFFFFWGWK